MVAALDAFVAQTCGQQPVALVVQGYVLSQYALLWAQQNERKVARLLILNTPLSTNSKLRPELAAYKTPLAFMRPKTFDGMMFNATGSAYVMEGRVAEAYARPYADPAASAAVASVMEKCDYGKLLKKVNEGFMTWKKPSVLMFGGSDPFLSVASAFEFLEDKRTNMKIISAAAKLGHCPQEDFAEALHETMLPWLAGTTDEWTSGKTMKMTKYGGVESSVMSAVTADERRRQKELDEARKAGLAPAEKDEDGKEINPHIPQYMTSAPWYLNKDKPTLQHQRNWNKKEGEDDPSLRWYDRGAKVFQATKWRKGSCENCGSMTHVTKDCLERPRNKGAKYTNKNIAADDKIEELKITGFDAKRDRWNGYDPKEYSKIIDRHEQLESIRKELKQKELAQELYHGKGGEAAAAVASAADDDDAKIREEEDAGFSEVKKRVRTVAGGSTGSVRNLRIREDTAKYLLNLDVNSAHYDPKTRSMREDPTPDKPLDKKTYAGDNFVRKSGDYHAWQELQIHAMTAFEKGADVNIMANPSLVEKMYQQFKAKKDSLAAATKQDVLQKYGNAAEKPPEELALLTGTEKYVEYDRMGRVVRGQENRARSRYEEDVYLNNHTSVFGSWWHDGSWGYACCHQTLKNSYCTGRAGERAAVEVAAQMVANMEAKAKEADELLQKRREESKLNGHKPHVDVWGSETAEVELDATKVKEAVQRLEKAEREAVDDEGKRKYNPADSANAAVTPEEMEAWRMKRSRADDPMQMLQKGGASNGYDLL
ncbi:Slu7 domain-containing protein [Haematococcus lacustris]|uniref:Pre-mRNA-splicing factor SLU7 n=1 Tax=Haematococcus lacustris TaxID=44745 RepID=A0A699Z2S7_HAELA|nr:Slu7 domain-containing protein [Haematococcus lacustris]